MGDELVETLKIAKLELGPGDTVVVKCKGTVSLEQMHNIQKCASKVWPDNRSVVIDENMDIQVVKVKTGMKLDVTPAFKKEA